MNNRFELGQIGQISHQLSNLSVVQEELRYGMSEKEKRNRAIFEEAGIRRMFQSYIDSKKVTMGNRSTCIELMGEVRNLPTQN